MKTLVLFAALSLPFLSDCVHAPAPGDTCQEGAAVCRAKDTALVCRDGKYEATGCRGPEGCSVTNNRDILCDQTAGARVGEVCLPTYLSQVQCTAEEPGRYLVCTQGGWSAVACPSGAVCTKREAAGGAVVLCEPARSTPDGG